MNKKVLRETLGWGFVLWLAGYLLGIILFFVVPTSVMGWIIMPIGAALTLLVLYKKIKSDDRNYYLTIASVWTIIAVIFDYFFIVKLLNPKESYYKPDVYIYYFLTFLLPLIVGWRKSHAKSKS